MNRKGLIFGFSMVIITLMALAYAYIVVSQKIDALPSYQVGEQQIALIDGYQAMEDKLNSIDRAALFAAKMAVIDLASGGGYAEPVQIEDRDGFYGPEGCGDYLGYPVWNNEEGFGCFPDYAAEYEDVFNNDLAGVLPPGSLRTGYKLSLEQKSGYTAVAGSTEGVIGVSKGVRSDAKGFGLSDDLLDANDVTSYDACDALHHYIGEESCFSTKEEDFDSVFVSFNSPYLRFVNNDQGNAARPEFAGLLLEAGKLWNEKKGGQAALGIYSVSTGVHSCTSKHNEGLAADISGCYDSDGSYHDSKIHDDVFKECESLLSDFWEGKGLFISYRSCRLEGHDCQSKQKETARHYNHIHLDKR